MGPCFPKHVVYLSLIHISKSDDFTLRWVKTEINETSPKIFSLLRWCDYKIIRRDITVIMYMEKVVSTICLNTR